MGRKTAHQVANAAQTALLILTMAAILCVVAYLFAGLFGVVVAAMVTAGIAALSRSIPKEMILRLYRAKRVGTAEFPLGHALMRDLAQRAELPRTPDLYVIPSEAPNAFAVGARDNAAVAVTVGLLNLLNPRELAGVLGHEVSHIHNGDLGVMSLADGMTRVARALAFSGFALLIGGVVAALLGAPSPAPWHLAPILIFAPVAMTFAQLALSRTREFDADHDGAQFSGDPLALASALKKLTRWQGARLDEMILTGRRAPEPSALRTHPPTEERVERLEALVGHVAHPPLIEPDQPTLAAAFRRTLGRPRMRYYGVYL